MRLARIAWSAFQAVAVALLLFLLLVTFTPVVPWYARLLAGPWTDPDGDILIVLSCDIQSDGLPGSISYVRSLYAVRAWRTGHFQRIVVSGGRMGDAPISLAASIRDVLVSNGVPQDVIFLEERSRSTRENALFTEALIHSWPGKRVLLTSDTHMFRAHRTFMKANMTVVPRPIPDTLKSANLRINRWNCALGLMVESMKIGYYAAKGWM
jgi:uncharacterized SAM-binding protein YcdF (DUF218 family)